MRGRDKPFAPASGGGGGEVGRTHSPSTPPTPRERYSPLTPLLASAGIPHPPRTRGGGGALTLVAPLPAWYGPDPGT